MKIWGNSKYVIVNPRTKSEDGANIPINSCEAADRDGIVPYQKDQTNTVRGKTEVVA